MNNLSKESAKAEYLNDQLEKTLEIYRSASPGERRASIKHIDSFLEALPGKEQKIFWLRLRQRLERMNEGFSMRPEDFQKIISGERSAAITGGV